MMEKNKNFMEKIFDACIEEARQEVRDAHAYGGKIGKRDRQILRFKPKEWEAASQNILKRRFVLRCKASNQVVGSLKDFADAFEDLLKA